MRFDASGLVRSDPLAGADVTERGCSFESFMLAEQKGLTYYCDDDELVVRDDCAVKVLCIPLYHFASLCTTLYHFVPLCIPFHPFPSLSITLRALRRAAEIKRRQPRSLQACSRHASALRLISQCSCHHAWRITRTRHASRRDVA
eukprot:2277587-Rhodomonas_salina.1